MLSINETTLDVGDQPVESLNIEVRTDGSMDISVHYVDPPGVIHGDLVVQGVVSAEGFGTLDANEAMAAVARAGQR